MKAVVLFLLCIVTCKADYKGTDLISSGQYIPDYSGRYIHDNSGNYIDDGSGRYSDNIEKYRHVQDRYVVQATNIRPVTQKPIPKINYSKLYSNQGGWRILRQNYDLGPQIYHYDYATENKIIGEEKGKIIHQGTKDEGVASEGFYEYIGPDNVKYHVKYTAGEGGFQPIGAHIPTPPPVPELIRKALELKEKRRFNFEAANGIKAEEKGNIKKTSDPENPEAVVATGSFSYTDPEGNQISLTYTADDEGGFQPQGAHLPTPPPIPPNIQKALDWIAAHPEPEQKAGRK
ncbi:unnamed protein product [Brassicogethes aeneus]|uniref:Uncharacterized protein n=1 Tax=Brassicogethes aeneus TaxID=1431903 RepID=A0A9P0BB11_BRAAE|nr:unnamed protein product [Brassicogethes aeneus]